MGLVILKGKQGLPDKLIVTTPLWQSLVVSPKTGLVSLFLIAWNDSYTSFDIVEVLANGDIVFDNLREHAIDRPIFKIYHSSIKLHGCIRLHNWQFIRSLRTLESNLRVTCSLFLTVILFVKESEFRTAIVSS